MKKEQFRLIGDNERFLGVGLDFEHLGLWLFFKWATNWTVNITCRKKLIRQPSFYLSRIMRCLYCINYTYVKIFSAPSNLKFFLTKVFYNKMTNLDTAVKNFILH